MHRTPHRYDTPDKVELVKATIARLETSWNHKNTYLWASAFTEPCQYIDAFGNYHRNWTHERNAKLHGQVWNSAYARSHARFLIESIDFISDHNCVVIIHCTIQYIHQEEERLLDTFITVVLEHVDQEWLIRNFQNTPVRST